MNLNKKHILIGAAAILILVVAFVVLRNGSVKYITKEVSKGTITQYVEASGTIKPINTIAVGTQVSGTVAKIYCQKHNKLLCKRIRSIWCSEFIFIPAYFF